MAGILLETHLSAEVPVERLDAEAALVGETLEMGDDFGELVRSRALLDISRLAAVEAVRPIALVGVNDRFVAPAGLRAGFISSFAKALPTCSCASTFESRMASPLPAFVVETAFCVSTGVAMLTGAGILGSFTAVVLMPPGA